MLLVPALPLIYPHVAGDLLSRRSALSCAGLVMSGMAACVRRFFLSRFPPWMAVGRGDSKSSKAATGRIKRNINRGSIAL